MSIPHLHWPIVPVLVVLAAIGPGRATAAAAAVDQPAALSFVEAGETAVGEPALVATAVGLRACGLAPTESADILLARTRSGSQLPIDAHH